MTIALATKRVSQHHKWFLWSNVPSGEFESSSYGFCPLKWYVINKFADHVVTEVSKVIQNFPGTDVKAIWLTNNNKSTDFQQTKSNTVPSL